MLVVEDGTGKIDSESYNSLDEIQHYADDHGLTFAITGDDTVLAEQAARRATTWLDARYGNQYSGYRSYNRKQALEWPRALAHDNAPAPIYIYINEIPREIKAAHCEAAIYEKANPFGLSPSVTPAKIKQQVTIGPMSVSYGMTGRSGVVVKPADMRPILTVVDDILAPLLIPSASASPSLLRC